MNVITKILNQQDIQKLVSVYHENIVLSSNPYIKYLIKVENCVISIYTSNKVVFQGQDALVYSSAFDDQTTHYIKPHAGSDEVGTGDFFGPVVICATILDDQGYQAIKHLNIQDSKKMNDHNIKEIAPILIDKIKHCVCILNNETYNLIHKKYNLNAIKAIMHNKAYIQLIEKYKDVPNLKVIDQFCEPKYYFKYLSKQPKTIKDLTFTTKAEDQYLAVALSSILARYYFLISFEKMIEKYNFNFHKGASKLVDQDIELFISRYGLKELEKVGKINFKNYQKITNDN